VSNALIDRQKLVEQLAAQQKLVARFATTLALAAAIRRGLRSLLTVLQAEQQLFPAELNLPPRAPPACRPW